jgi:4-amino-4-deoxy-L-arabinose transferase-like glycosyltransferase
MTQARTRALSLERIVKLALAAILALGFLTQGIHAPFEKDEESRPAGLVRDVVRHGDWLVPRDDYGEASRKPPLFYWLTVIAA